VGDKQTEREIEGTERDKQTVRDKDTEKERMCVREQRDREREKKVCVSV